MKTAHDLVMAAKAEIHEVAVSEAEAAVRAADVVLDVREGHEYRDGHIGGAINMPRGLLEFLLTSDAALQDRSLDVVVYCKSSGRAALAAKTMRDMGYLHVTSIAGGFDGWKEAGLPVSEPAQPDIE